MAVKREGLHDRNPIVTGSTGAPEAGHMTGDMASPGAGLRVGHMTGHETERGMADPGADHVTEIGVAGPGVSHVTKRGMAGLGASHMRRKGMAGQEADLTIGNRGSLGADLVKRENKVGPGAGHTIDGVGGLRADHTVGDVAIRGQSPETAVGDGQGAGLELMIWLGVKGHTLVVYQVVHAETKLKSTGKVICFNGILFKCVYTALQKQRFIL